MTARATLERSRATLPRRSDKAEVRVYRGAESGRDGWTAYAEVTTNEGGETVIVRALYVEARRG